jgi:glutaredoxin
MYMDQLSVTLFTSATCPYCKEIRHYFQQRRQQFTERRVDLDPAAARLVVETIGDELVPVVMVQKDEALPVAVVGFDRQRLDVLLEVS